MTSDEDGSARGKPRALSFDQLSFAVLLAASCRPDSSRASLLVPRRRTAYTSSHGPAARSKARTEGAERCLLLLAAPSRFFSQPPSPARARRAPAEARLKAKARPKAKAQTQRGARVRAKGVSTHAG